MTERPYVSHATLRIDGAYVEEAQGDLVEIVVDHTLHMPSMFVIRLRNHDMRWSDDEHFQEGKRVEVLYGEDHSKMISGKIAGVEPMLQEQRPTITVRGYDDSHKLYRGRHRRSFTGVTDSDLVKKLAAESDVRLGTVESTSETHDYVFQNNQTNAEFLLERAQRIGYELWMGDEVLNFRKPSPDGGAVTLKWGDTLTDFHPRLSTVEQINEVEVRGWDPKTKKEVIGRATQGQGQPSIGVGGPGADLAKKSWGQAASAVVHTFVRSPAEAEAQAQAALNQAASSFVEAEGSCLPMPDLFPGRQVTVQGVGDRFSGTYYLSRIRHVWTQGKGWATHFTVSGARDRGLLSMLQGSSAKSQSLGTGLVIGLVTNNNDPDDMGRVKVKFPWLSDSDESAWARLVSPMAGKDRGLFILPEVDDEVLVGFEHGDIHRPFVLGALWNGQDNLPMSTSQVLNGSLVEKRVLKTRAGHQVVLDDTDGKQQVTLQTQGGHSMVLDDTSGGQKLSVKTTDGHSMVMDDTGKKVTVKSSAGHTVELDDSGGTITVVDKSGSNKIVIQTNDNSMQISILGDLTIDAKGKVSITGQTGVTVSTPAQLQMSGTGGAELSSSASTKVSGTNTEVSATAQAKLSGLTAEVDGTAQAKLSGAMVDISGTGPVSVSGLPIKLN